MGIPSGYTSAQVVQAVPTGINSALVFLTGATFTTATSFSLATNTFSSTYLNYKMFVNLQNLSSDADFTLRMRASGADNTASSYNSVQIGLNSSGTASNVTQFNQTSFNVGECDAGFPIYVLALDILQPQIAKSTVCLGQLYYLNKPEQQFHHRSVSLQFNTTAQFDSLSFISSVASSLTGTYRVYGYTES